MLDKLSQTSILENKREAKSFSSQRNTDMTTYTIIDIQTKAQVGKVYDNRSRARKQADRLDLKYGAVRYIVKAHFAEEV